MIADSEQFVFCAAAPAMTCAVGVLAFPSAPLRMGGRAVLHDYCCGIFALCAKIPQQKQHKYYAAAGSRLAR
jgi:hypothetical protein